MKDSIINKLRSSMNRLFSIEDKKTQLPEGMDSQLIDFKISAPPADFGSEQPARQSGESDPR